MMNVNNKKNKLKEENLMLKEKIDHFIKELSKDDYIIKELSNDDYNINNS